MPEETTQPEDGERAPPHKFTVTRRQPGMRGAAGPIPIGGAKTPPPPTLKEPAPPSKASPGPGRPADPSAAGQRPLLQERSPREPAPTKRGTAAHPDNRLDEPANPKALDIAVDAATAAVAATFAALSVLDLFRTL